jgi:lipopolysaccharide export system ATP-binding protein
MLLDEPFAGIDPLAIADIREVIGYLKGRGIGILITDHNVRETLDIIDRASIIHAGEVLFEGSPREIVDDPEVRASIWATASPSRDSVTEARCG